MSQPSVVSPGSLAKGKNESKGCMEKFIGLCRAGKVESIRNFVDENAELIDINKDNPLTKVSL